MTITINHATSPETIPAHDGGEVKVALTTSAEEPVTDQPLARHIVLCIDASGSMGNSTDSETAIETDDDSRLAHAKAGALRTLAELEAADHLAVTSFNTSAEPVLDPIALADVDPDGAPAESIGDIESGGRTDIRAGLESARDQLQQIDADQPANEMILLLSDGKDNKNDEEDFDELLEELSEAGVTVMTAGIGDYDDALMARIADETDGMSHHLTELADIETFIEAAVVAAGDVLHPDPVLQVRTGESFELNDAGIKLTSSHKDSDVKSRSIESAGRINRIDLPSISGATELMVMLQTEGEPRRPGMTAVVADIEVLSRGEVVASTTATVQYADQETGLKKKLENDWRRIQVGASVKEGAIERAESVIDDAADEDEELAIELREQTELDRTEL